MKYVECNTIGRYYNTVGMYLIMEIRARELRSRIMR